MRELHGSEVPIQAGQRKAPDQITGKAGNKWIIIWPEAIHVQPIAQIVASHAQSRVLRRINQCLTLTGVPDYQALSGVA